MRWKPEVEELERRRRLAAAMGGPDGIERQRKRGKLTVRERITALARVHGYPVGVMINNPKFLGGSMDVAAGTKVVRFIQLCDASTSPWSASPMSRASWSVWRRRDRGSMHIEGGASAAYRREIDASEDPESKRDEIERRLQAFASPLRTAETFDIEDVIDPRETRPILCEFIEMAQPMLKTQLGPTPGPSYQP